MLMNIYMSSFYENTFAPLLLFSDKKNPTLNAKYLPADFLEFYDDSLNANTG